MSILLVHMDMSTDQITQKRDTKYCKAISVYVQRVGHATNAMILAELQKEFPALSATTVHRATARLAERGELGVAPPNPSGSIRYDNNTEAHDHFMCSTCGMLRDTMVADTVKPLIESQLDGCHISGNLTITGTCKSCSAVK